MNCVLSKSFARCYRLFEGQSKIIKRNRWTELVTRTCSTTVDQKSGPLLYHRLANRAVIRVVGPDAALFLQGLMTNDIRHLSANDKGPPPKDCIYSMLLNQHGRVLHDLLVYKTTTPSTTSTTDDTFLLECDHSLSPDLIKHLTTFKIRKRLTVTPTDNTLWCLFTAPDHLLSTDHEINTTTTNPSIRHDAESVVAVSPDPRQKALGIRLILSHGATPPEVTTNHVLPDENEQYRVLRYRLGIAEGAVEIPSGSALPLEYNADYLHGVSFQKGCYIGQELTARIHHTGVVRKRLLPLVLLDGEGSGSVVVNEKGKTVGRLSGVLGRFGVGVMRLQECLADGGRLTIGEGGTGVRTYQPSWWPAELPKENLAASNK